jgi:ankyrin repeat protein
MQLPILSTNYRYRSSYRASSRSSVSANTEYSSRYHRLDSDPFDLFESWDGGSRGTLRLERILEEASENPLSDFARPSRPWNPQLLQTRPSHLKLPAERIPSSINRAWDEESIGGLTRGHNGRLAFRWLQALYDCNVEEVKLLLDDGPGPDFRLVVGEEGMTKWIIPLHKAVLRSLEVTKLLLDHGAKVDITYLNSGTALQRVPRFSLPEIKLEVMQLLIHHGANINARPGVHGTALIAAIEDQNSTLVSLLVDHGADLDQHGGLCHRYTPLAAAARTGNNNIIAMLNKYYADIKKPMDSRRSHPVSFKSSEKWGVISSLSSQGVGHSSKDENCRHGEKSDDNDDDASCELEYLETLNLWQMETAKRTFPTFFDLTKEFPNSLLKYGEIIIALDWEVPEVIYHAKAFEDNSGKAIDFTNNVVFLATSNSELSVPSTSCNVQAISFSEYMGARGVNKHADVIYEIMDLLNDANFEDMASGKQFLFLLAIHLLRILVLINLLALCIW